MLKDHVKEKLRLVQDFLHVDAQNQLMSLEEMMKSSEISKVGNSFRKPNIYSGIWLFIACGVCFVIH